jgi:protein-export membrane protein SecD
MPQRFRSARPALARGETRVPAVYPDNGEKLKAIDEGKDVIPPEFRIESYKMQREGEKPIEERLLAKKKADLAGARISNSAASYEKAGWVVHLRFDAEGAKKFGDITAANVHHRFAIVLDGVIFSAPVIQDAIYGGDAQITGRFSEEEARGLEQRQRVEHQLQTPVKIEEERQVGQSWQRLYQERHLFGHRRLCPGGRFHANLLPVVGLIADIALLINCIMVVGALGMFNSVLTLPGIAGLILSLDRRCERFDL